MEMDIKDKSKNSPRFKELKKLIDAWVNKYGESEKNGIDLVLVGCDNEYKHSIKFTLGNKKDQMESIIQAFNHGLCQLKDPLEQDIFNGMCEYLARVFITKPDIYKHFKHYVEQNISNEYYNNTPDKLLVN